MVYILTMDERKLNELSTDFIASPHLTCPWVAAMTFSRTSWQKRLQALTSPFFMELTSLPFS